MAQNRKTQRKFRRKSSKKNVGKRKTKVNHKRKNLHKKSNKKNKKILNRRSGGEIYHDDGTINLESSLLKEIEKKINEIIDEKGKEALLNNTSIKSIIDNFEKRSDLTSNSRKKIYNGTRKAIKEFALPEGDERLKKYETTFKSTTEGDKYRFTSKAPENEFDSNIYEYVKGVLKYTPVRKMNTYYPLSEKGNIEQNHNNLG